MILLGKDEGIIEEKEKEYILNIFNFNDIEVEKVMTLKKDVVLLNIDDDIKKNILKMKKAKYSRYPVYKDNENNIIGIINVNDLVIQHKELEKVKLKDLIRKVIRFNYSKKIDDVFRTMKEKNESISFIY